MLGEENNTFYYRIITTRRSKTVLNTGLCCLPLKKVFFWLVVTSLAAELSLTTLNLDFQLLL